MIDLPTQKDMNHPHHRRAVAALVAAGVVFIALLAVYFFRPVPVENPPQDSLAARQALMNVPNPTINLTPDQVATQKKLMTVSNPTVKLTPAQVEQQKKLMGIQ